MIGIAVNVVFYQVRVLSAAGRGAARTLGNAAKIVAQTARGSIKTAGKVARRAGRRGRKRVGAGGVIVSDVDPASPEEVRFAQLGFAEKHLFATPLGQEEVSEPGEPPLSHTGELRDKIFWAYETLHGGFGGVAYVGPVRVANQAGVAPPGVLEHGGYATIRRRVNGRMVERRVRIEPRPYMRPALEELENRTPSWIEELF